MGKKFIASYSSGKDSTLAIYKAIKEGMEPVKLILTQNNDPAISWFHGLSDEMVEALQQIINIPIEKIVTNSEAYAKDFEAALRKGKQEGAEVCVFGDIDIEGHLEWCSERCKNAGLEAYFPLWHRDRKSVVLDFINSGFSTYLTVVNTNVMNEKYIGKQLTEEIVEQLEQEGVDVCGENGEYHSLVTDGPIFTHSLDVKFGNPEKQGHYICLPVECK